MATASVAGDLGTMDDFEQPKLHVPLKFQKPWQLPSYPDSAFKKFSPTLLNNPPFVSTLAEQIAPKIFNK